MDTIRFIRLDPSSQEPQPLFPMSQGFDILASENVLIEKGRRAFVETNIGIKLPPHFFAVLNGTETLNRMGAFVKSSVIDDTFSGRIRVLIENEGSHDLPIMAGDRVASVIIAPVAPPMIQVKIYFSIQHN